MPMNYRGLENVTIVTFVISQTRRLRFMDKINDDDVSEKYPSRPKDEILEDW